MYSLTSCGPFRNLMTAAMAPQVLSSDCFSPGPSTAPGVPRCLCPDRTGQAHGCHIVWKRCTQNRVGPHSRGLRQLRAICRVVPMDKECYLWPYSPFPNISLVAFKTPRINVILWSKGPYFLSPKVHTSTTRWILACSEGKTIHAQYERSRYKHRWVGTSAQGLLLGSLVWPPLGVILVLWFEVMISTWKELKWWLSMFVLGL